MNKDKRQKDYTRTLEEISREFTISKKAIEAEQEIDDRHLIEDLAVADEDDGEEKVDRR